jgi:hypothetical protein
VTKFLSPRDTFTNAGSAQKEPLIKKKNLIKNQLRYTKPSASDKNILNTRLANSDAKKKPNPIMTGWNPNMSLRNVNQSK